MEKKIREINQCYSSKEILPQKNIFNLLLPFLKTCSYIYIYKENLDLFQKG